MNRTAAAPASPAADPSAETIDVLLTCRTSPEDRAAFAAVDPRIRLTDAGGWFDGELRAAWPAATCDRYLPAGTTGEGSRAGRDALLARAEVALIGFPFPLDLRARSPRLRWVQQRPAGASNLIGSDLWGGDVPVATARGHAANLPIAEYVVASFLHFARGFHRASLDRAAGVLDSRAYGPVLLAGKTACVVGAGGIGQAVARLAAAVGLRVTGARRSAGGALPDGFAEMRPPADLHALLAGADFVALCCPWTPETDNLMDAAAFAAMKPGAVLVNVARGEIVDEAALLDALAAGRLRGAALDVYRGEFEGAPDPRLWADPRVLITPHVSTGSDAPAGRAMDVFRRNLAAYAAGRPLENVIDWARGY